MNIIKIYNKYHLPANLQMHMLRVAACSNLIIDNWNGQKLDKEAIIRVCLLHDMGNMVKKSNFGKFLLLWTGELISSVGGGLTSFGLGVLSLIHI